MGYRLSKIYTRTGDDGTTGLADGSRVEKDNELIKAIGDVDELNCQIGVVVANLEESALREILTDIQNRLFDLGAELSLPPGHDRIRQQDVDALESVLDQYNADLAPLKDFILPGGSESAAHCHLARAVCRRAERSLVSVQRTNEVSAYSMRFLNRLSDLLFVMARAINQHHGYPDVLWVPLEKPGS